jgi:hypothetical protein
MKLERIHEGKHGRKPKQWQHQKIGKAEVFNSHH